MKNKKMKVKIDPYLHLRFFSLAYFLMAILHILCFAFDYQECTALDFVIFAIVDAVLLWVSVTLYRLRPLRVLTDGEKLYIRNTVTKETKEWNLSSFSAVYRVCNRRRVCYLIFSDHAMCFEEQNALYQRAWAEKDIILEHTLVFVRTDKFWKKLIPAMKDRIPFYEQADMPPVIYE